MADSKNMGQEINCIWSVILLYYYNIYLCKNNDKTYLFIHFN